MGERQNAAAKQGDSSQAINASDMRGGLEAANIDCSREELRLLNNAHFNLPGGFYRTKPLMSLFEPGETFLGFLERAARENNTQVSQAEVQRYSTLKLGQTALEFFAAVDKAIVECGLDLTAIEEKTIHVQRAFGIHRHELGMELREIILPVYKLMISQGYSHQDITG